MIVPLQFQMTPKFSEWKKRKRKESDNKRQKINNSKYGKKESRKLASPSGNWMIYKKPPSKNNKMPPKSVLLKLLRQPSKTESKLTSQCTISSAKNGKPSFSRCLSTTKDRKLTNSNKWPDYIEKDSKGLSICWKKTWSPLTVIWMSIREKQETRLKEPRIRQERRMRKWR